MDFSILAEPPKDVNDRLAEWPSVRRVRAPFVGKLGSLAPVIFPGIAVPQRTQRQHAIEIAHLPPRARLLQPLAHHALARTLHLTTPYRTTLQ